MSHIMNERCRECPGRGLLGCDRRCERGGSNMGYATKEETKEERKARLDKEWEKNLPCANCHPKMQRLCKHFNTFKRPDYNAEQFHISEIICDDRIDPPMEPAVEPLMSVPHDSGLLI